MTRPRTARQAHLTASLPMIALVIIAQVGCVDPFDGTRIEATLSGVLPLCAQIQKSNLGLAPCRDDGGTAYHLEIWAVLHNATLVRAQVFTLQKQVDESALTELERDEALLPTGVPFRYLPDSTLAEFAAQLPQDYAKWKQIVALLGQITAVTSYAPTKYTEGKTLHPDYYVGNHDPLTLPKNGKHLGVVTTLFPIGGAFEIGHITFKSDVVLDDLSSVFVTVESRPADRDAPTPSAHLLLTGRPQRIARGVTSVELTSPTDPAARGHFSVFTGLADRDYF